MPRRPSEPSPEETKSPAGDRAAPLRPPDGEAILLAWVAKNARAAPLLTVLDRPSALYGRISTLILLSRETADPDDRAALDETLTEVRARLGSACPTIDVRRWRTDTSPTDHAAIRFYVEGVLKGAREAAPAAHLYLFLSPGTPAMHAVWLVLGATGFVSGPLTMIQGVPTKDRRPGQHPVEAVPVDVDNWLRRFRAARPTQTDTDDDGALWDPASLHPRGAMRAALDQLERWKDLPAPVLLVGERGTGKTTLANALRAMSRFQRTDKRGRPEARWPAVVCGQFRSNPQLARGDLFGYRKGAFTGADREHVGLIEQADGDSLFLDEIADLDRDTQRLLMAALEGRGFRRLGETEERRAKFRLICATNRPLESLRGEALDEDFYDRISVFVLDVPPLRRCREDLPVIWRQVWRKIATAAGVFELLPPKVLSPVEDCEGGSSAPEALAAKSGGALAPQSREALAGVGEASSPTNNGRSAGHFNAENSVAGWARATVGALEDHGALLGALAHHGLPGNLRDLQRVAWHLAAHALAGEHADEAVRRALQALGAGASGGSEEECQLPLSRPLPELLRRQRERWTRAALARAGGNRSEAARLLGVKRETFKEWVRELDGVHPPVNGENPPDDPMTQPDLGGQG